MEELKFTPYYKKFDINEILTDLSIISFRKSLEKRSQLNGLLNGLISSTVNNLENYLKSFNIWVIKFMFNIYSASNGNFVIHSHIIDSCCNIYRIDLMSYINLQSQLSNAKFDLQKKHTQHLSDFIIDKIKSLKNYYGTKYQRYRIGYAGGGGEGEYYAYSDDYQQNIDTTIIESYRDFNEKLIKDSKPKTEIKPLTPKKRKSVTFNEETQVKIFSSLKESAKESVLHSRIHLNRKNHKFFPELYNELEEDEKLRFYPMCEILSMIACELEKEFNQKDRNVVKISYAIDNNYIFYCIWDNYGQIYKYGTKILDSVENTVKITNESYKLNHFQHIIQNNISNNKFILPDNVIQQIKKCKSLQNTKRCSIDEIHNIIKNYRESINPISPPVISKPISSPIVKEEKNDIKLAVGVVTGIATCVGLGIIIDSVLNPKESNPEVKQQHYEDLLGLEEIYRTSPPSSPQKINFEEDVFGIYSK
jgi:hypothetical protein